MVEKRIAFERATDLVAHQLANYRDGWDSPHVEPTENERLLAGHIVGNLWANDLLNTAGEEWVRADGIEDRMLEENDRSA